MAVIGSALRKSPKQAGVGDEGVWDGKTLSSFVMKRFGVDLQGRQCQRLFRQLGFRRRKPRPLLAHADPEAQRAYKKTAKAGARRL